MDLLLCNSLFQGKDLDRVSIASVYPPLGLLYLSAYLKREDVGESRVFDATFAQDERELIRCLELSRPRLLGVQTTITGRDRARALLAHARRLNISTVVGGPDASASYEEYLGWGADYAVIGEGEQTCAELLAHLVGRSGVSLQDIAGLAYRADGRIVVNRKRQTIQDVDTIPFPDWGAISIERYLDHWRKKNGHTSLHVMSSRGCPYQCTWCSRAVFGRTVRRRSVANVLNEVALLKDLYNPDSLWFADDTFTLSAQWTRDFCEAICRRGLLTPFRCFTRADRVTPALLSQLKQAGCRLIHLGVESGSQRVLAAMKKGQDVDAIRRATSQIKEAGIAVNYFIMLGYVGEQLEDIRETEALLSAAKPETVGFSVAYPVPGTEFYQSVRATLVQGAEDRWSRTSRSPQQLFHMEFPLFYYVATIRHLQLRGQMKWQSARLFLQPGIWLRITYWAIVRALVEHVWSWLRADRGRRRAGLGIGDT